MKPSPRDKRVVADGKGDCKMISKFVCKEWIGNTRTDHVLAQRGSAVIPRQPRRLEQDAYVDTHVLRVNDGKISEHGFRVISAATQLPAV